MRKSFTWFLSLMVLVIAFATHGYAQEAQETVELYAEVASDCYNEADDYTVTIAVRDFIQLTQFDLDLEYNDAIFAYDGSSSPHASLPGLAVDGSTAGVVTITWDAAAATIGDNVKTDILVLHFTLNGYPGNIAESFASDMEWTKSDFWYTKAGGLKDMVNTVVATDGSLTVNVGLTDIETEFTAESCAGGDVTVTVTAPAAEMYLFNEDADPGEWDWTTSPSYLAAAGETVTIRIKDTDGCMSLVSSVVLPETVEPVDFDATTQDPSCYGAKGSVVISATGGTAPYTYWIANDDGTTTAPDLATIKEKTNFQFSMAPGDYWVNVQDKNDCADFDNTWMFVSIEDNNPEIAGAITTTDVGCFGGSTGTIAVTISETPLVGDDYQISINGGTTWGAVNVMAFTNLKAGDYSVKAKNSNGCVVAIDVVTIDEPDAIAFDIEIDDTSCGDDTDDGQITVINVTGGTTPYSYSLDGTDWTNTTGIFPGLAPVYYSLWVKDAAGCIKAYVNPNGTGNTIAVQSPEDLDFKVVVTDPLCHDEDASLAITDVTGGTGSYEYSFDGGSTWVDTMTVDAWPFPYALTGVVMVRNDDGTCALPWTTPIVVDNPDMLGADTHEVFAPTCIDGNDGNITLHIWDGTAPYTYTINGSSEKTTSDATSVDEYVNIKVGVGTHTITVEDANGCTTADVVVTVTLEENEITATAGATIDCFGDKAGTIAVSIDSWADGGAGRTIKYYVENEAGVVTSFVPSTATFNAGTYSVWAVDSYTCESNVEEVTITQNAELKIASVNANGASCFGSFEGTVTVQATGGNTDELEYAVVNNEGALGNIADDKWLQFDTYDGTVTPPLSTVSFQVDAGTYWIAVRDDGCDEKTYGPIVVEGYTELLVDEEEIETEESMCYLDSMATITVPMNAVTGGAGSYLFTLLVDDEGDWVEVEGKVDQVTGVFTELPAGSYQVLVEDAENCPSYTTDPIEIEDPDELTFTTSIKNMSCWNSNDGRIVVNASGGTGDYWYAINNKNTWIPFESGATSKTYIVTETGTFSVWVKDENGCESGPAKITITAPTQLGADITVESDVTCPGGSDGAISVVGEGGWATMSDYEFKVNNGSWLDAASIAALSLPAGDHILHVRDVYDYSGNYQDLDCEESVEFTIDEPGLITYDVTIEDVKCKDGDDGTFTVTILSGGTPDEDDGYMVQLTGDDYDETVWTGTDGVVKFEDLAHSFYTVYITDANGCTLLPTADDSNPPYTTIESWEVAEPAEMLTLDPNWINDVTCYDGEDGKIELVADGGSAPYKYYAGLSKTDDGHVLIPNPPAAGSDKWLDTDTLMVGAGTWVTWVMDANGCVVGGEYDQGVAVNKWRVKVEQPDEVEWAFHMMGSPAVVHYVMPSCYGEWDGEIHLVNIMGGSGTYNAHVTGLSADSMVVDKTYTNIKMSGGLYKLTGVPASVPSGLTVTVTDSKGCTSDMDQIFIDQPDMLEVDLVPGAGAFTCADAVEGLIEAVVTGGTKDYEYQLLKNGVVHTPWQSDGSAFLVEVGNTFIVQVRDENGCTAADTIIIAPIAPVVITSINNTSCFGAVKASATVNATAEEGRMLTVKYRLYEKTSTYTEVDEEFTSSIDLLNLFEFDAENIDDVHYEFIVTDDMGCESDPDTITFDYVQTELVLSVDMGETTECTSVLTMEVGGGSAPYTVMVGDSVLTGLTYTAARGTYEVTVYDSHGCMKAETVVVEGTYVVRDTTIETYIGEETAFVDAESGIDSMLSAELSPYAFPYTLDCERTLNVTVVEIPRPYTIAEVQGEGDVSPIEGKIAQVSGRITAIAAGEGFFIQDANVANSGLYVSFSEVDGYSVGDDVTVVGKVTEIANVTSVMATSVALSVDNFVITPMELAPTAAQAEMYESMLVTVLGGRATAADAGNGEWSVYYETSDDITVNNWLYSSTPVEGHYFNVTGIINGRLDAFKLEPRMASDVVDVTATDVAPELEAVEFSVYPNPFNDVINVVNHDKLTRVVISNIAGQRVIDVAYPNSEIRTGNLVSGIYVVSMFTENGIAKTEKIIKK